MSCIFVFSAHISARVSSKIQQLLNTLKRPKRKPLQDFFVEEDDELESKLLQTFTVEKNQCFILSDVMRDTLNFSKVIGIMSSV